jgi:hypothetical protein
VDLADSADHGQMAVAVADVSLGAGDAGGQPLPVLHGNEPVLAAVPDLDRHPDVAQVEPPARQLRRSVIPPALVARGESDLVGLGQPSEQVPGQHLGVDGGDEALQVCAELLRRGREDLLPALAQIEAGRLLVGEEQLKAPALIALGLPTALFLLPAALISFILLRKHRRRRRCGAAGRPRPIPSQAG